MATRLTSKGQVTVPRAIRAHLGVGPGDSVTFAVTAAGQVVLHRSGGEDRFEAALARIKAEPPIQGWTTDAIMTLTRGHDW